MKTTGPRVGVVTGGGGGIGSAICRALSAEGMAVAVVDVDAGKAMKVAGEITERGGIARAFETDVSDPRGANRVIEQVGDVLGPVHVLVNNAALKTNAPGTAARVVEMPDELWLRTLEVNLSGPFWMSRAVAKQMIACGIKGSIINITSPSARFARPGAAHYCASKAGLLLLTKVLAIELGGHGIRVNAVCPGLIDVEPRPVSPQRQQYLDAVLRDIPLGRFGTPEDVARVVVFLAEQAPYVTGEEYAVTGGSTAGRSYLPLSSA